MIIFALFLIPLITDKTIILILLGFSVMATLFTGLNYFLSGEDLHYGNNRKYVLSFVLWVGSKKEFPSIYFQETRTVKQIVTEDEEHLNLLDRNTRWTGYAKLADFSGYLLNGKTYYLVEELEKFLLEWGDYLEEHDLINPASFKIKFS